MIQNGDYSNKRLNGYNPDGVFSDGNRDDRIVARAIMARLDDAGARGVDISADDAKLMMDTLREIMQRGKERARVTAASAMAALLKYNLSRIDVADKLARGGNMPMQVTPKVYINVPREGVA